MVAITLEVDTAVYMSPFLVVGWSQSPYKCMVGPDRCPANLKTKKIRTKNVMNMVPNRCNKCITKPKVMTP